MTNWFRGSCVGFVLGAALLMTERAPIAQQPPAAAAPVCQPAGAPARGGQPGAGRAAQAPAGQGGQAQAGRAAGARAGGGGATPPPIPWAAPPLPDGPITVQSAAQAHRNLRLVVTKGLFHPWGMAFLPDGGILITERPGCLRIVRNGVLDPKLVAGLPPISAQGLSGLMDIALHPRFAENKFLYLTYHKPNPAAAGVPPGPNAPPARLATLARGTWDGTALTNVRELFSADVTTEASRILFGPDGLIYMSLGRSQEGANCALAGSQQLRRQAAAAARRRHRASGQSVRRPRRVQAGDLHDGPSHAARSVGEPIDRPALGERAGAQRWRRDERRQGGKNYGWPIVSYGRSYPGPRVSERPWQEGMEQPVVVWIPSIALSA